MCKHCASEKTGYVLFRRNTWKSGLDATNPKELAEWQGFPLQINRRAVYSVDIHWKIKDGDRVKKIGTLAEVDLVCWVVHVLIGVFVIGITNSFNSLFKNYILIRFFRFVLTVPFLLMPFFVLLEIILAVVSAVYTVKKIRRKEFDLSFYIVLGYTAFVLIACVVGLPALHTGIRSV